MMIIYDDNIWWYYMMTIYDDNIWWSYMMIIYDDHIWWSYMMITYDHHIWQSYMMIINDHHHICHLGVIWESYGKHMGDIWESFGIHLGAIWDPFGDIWEDGGWRGIRGQISYHVPHSRTECKSFIKIAISRGVFEGTINYDCIFTARSAPRQRAGSRG